MTDTPSDSDPSLVRGAADPSAAGAPRWAKLMGVVVAGLVLMLVLGMLTGGHGPGRHGGHPAGGGHSAPAGGDATP